MQIEGVYFDGRSSRQYVASLKSFPLSSPQIVISVAEGKESQQTVFKLAFKDLKINSRLGDTPRELEFGESKVFVTQDNDAVDKLNRQFSGSASIDLLSKLESHLPLVAFVSVLSVALLWLAIAYGIPGSADLIARQLPVHALNRFGDGLSVLDQTMFEPSALEPERERRLRSLFAPYMEPHAHLQAKLHFRSMGAPNAFALPDGAIVLTDELLKLAENDEQLIAVLLHEIGHLHHRHMVRHVVRRAMVTLLVALVAGDIGSVDLVAGLPVLLISLSYSRSFEEEADNFAVEQLCQVGISPKHFADFFRLMEARYGLDVKGSEAAIDLLSTHPSSEKRMRLASTCPDLTLLQDLDHRTYETSSQTTDPGNPA